MLKIKTLPYLLITALIAMGCSKDDDEKESDLESEWKLLETPTENDLNDIHFSSNNFGVACGSFGAFLKTDDGGENWQSLDVGVGSTFISVFALDSNEFFTARIGLYKTTDSGVSFNEMGNTASFGSSIFGIHFFDSENGILSKGSTVYRTNDGGNNWLPVYPHEGDAKILEVAGNTAYLAGGATYDSVSYGELHKSNDNGETWEALNLPEEVGAAQITAIDFLTSQTGYLSTFEGKIFRSDDGGITWINQAELSFPFIADLLFTDEANGYLISQNKIYSTADGGVEWLERFQAEADVSFNSIAATPDGTLFVSGSNGIIYRGE